MELARDIYELLEGAEQKVLATVGADGPNAVPLSMVVVEPDAIFICDCFMEKTVENIRTDARVSLAAWTGFSGVQVKGRVVYETDGEHFDRFVAWLRERHPDRTLRGVLVLTPEAVYDLAPGSRGTQLA